MAHGEYNHIEIPYDDEERAKRFYSGVFGWEFSQMEGFDGYDLYRSGPGELGGGLGKRGESAGADDPQLHRRRLDRRRGEKVEELGGTITRAEGRDPRSGLVRDRHRQRGQPDRPVREPSPLLRSLGRIGDNPPVRLVDSHCHLQADRFDADVDQVIGAARLAGVERILVPGWNPRSRAGGALELVDRFRGSTPRSASIPTTPTGRRRRAGPRSPRSRRPARRRDRGDRPRLRPAVLADAGPAREPATEPRGSPPTPASRRSSTAGRRPAGATPRTRCSPRSARSGPRRRPC